MDNNIYIGGVFLKSYNLDFYTAIDKRRKYKMNQALVYENYGLKQQFPEILFQGKIIIIKQ